MIPRDQSCGNCVYMLETPYPKCLRYPPKIIAMHGGNGDMGFPSVNAKWWCGEWKGVPQ